MTQNSAATSLPTGTPDVLQRHAGQQKASQARAQAGMRERLDVTGPMNGRLCAAAPAIPRPSLGCKECPGLAWTRAVLCCDRAHELPHFEAFSSLVENPAALASLFRRM